MIPVIIFTFRDDGRSAVFAAQSAINAGLGPVFVAFDRNKPVSRPVLTTLRNAGCTLIETDFTRKPGLRGIHSFHGAIQVYKFVLKRTGASHVVKLDSDTYITRAERIKSAVANDFVAAAASQQNPEYPFMGMCYALSARAVLAADAFLSTWGHFPAWDSDTLPEDKVWGDVIPKLTGEAVLSWPFNRAGGFANGWQYDASSISLEEAADRFDVITFGNRHLIKASTPCVARRTVATTMRRFHRIVRNRVDNPRLDT